MKLLRTIAWNSSLTVLVSCLFWLLIFSMSIQSAAGQQVVNSASERAEAYQHLTALRTGTLVVVLKSDNKKRLELQKIIDDPSVSASQRRRAEKQLKTSIRDRSNFHVELVEGFEQAYSFSDYRLIYDSDLIEFLEGDQGLLLNSKLKHDASIELKEKGDLYFAREGYTESSESARVLSYIVYDGENNRLKSPFPSVKISNIGPAMLFRSLFDKTDYREGVSIVERLDYLLKHRMASLKDN